MWADAEVKARLIAGAAVDQPDGVRARALGVLANLALDAANQRPMWDDAEVKERLLAGAAVDQHIHHRAFSCRALALLSKDDALCPSLVAAGVRPLLLNADIDINNGHGDEGFVVQWARGRCGRSLR